MIETLAVSVPAVSFAFGAGALFSGGAKGAGLLVLMLAGFVLAIPLIMSAVL